LIARINPAAFQARVGQDQANLDAAQAGVANAEPGEKRAKAGIQASNASVGAAGANVFKTQVAVHDAKVKAGRHAQLAKQGVLSKEDVDTAQATYDTAAAARDAVVAQQSAAEDNMKVSQAELKVANTQLAANREPTWPALRQSRGQLSGGQHQRVAIVRSLVIPKSSWRRSRPER